MATSSTIPSSLSLPIFLLFLFLQLTDRAFATFASSSVASDQTDFWSKNVVNSMPEVIVSKLSPLSNQDSASLASSILKPSVHSEGRFCSMANLACAALQNGPMALGYTGGYITPKSISHLSDEVDPNSFFRISILKTGKKVQLPNLNNQFPARSFLPSIIASKISTTSATGLQKLFPNSLTSVSAKETIEISNWHCSSPAVKGEIKSCPKSLEDMIEFSKNTLGVTKVMSLTSESTKGSKKVLEIANIKQFSAQKILTCHEVFFPFASYLCHLLSSSSIRIYAVDFVEPTTKAPVNKIVAVCHMDTSVWAADHVSFKILKFSPGEGEACHWFTKVDLAWIGNGEKKF